MRNSPLGVAGLGMSANAHHVRAQSRFFSCDAKTFLRTTDLDTQREHTPTARYWPVSEMGICSPREGSTKSLQPVTRGGSNFLVRTIWTRILSFDDDGTCSCVVPSVRSRWPAVGENVGSTIVVYVVWRCSCEAAYPALPACHTPCGILPWIMYCTAQHMLDTLVGNV